MDLNDEDKDSVLNLEILKLLKKTQTLADKKEVLNGEKINNDKNKHDDNLITDKMDNEDKTAADSSLISKFKSFLVGIWNDVIIKNTVGLLQKKLDEKWLEIIIYFILYMFTILYSYIIYNFTLSYSWILNLSWLLILLTKIISYLNGSKGNSYFVSLKRNRKRIGFLKQLPYIFTLLNIYISSLLINNMNIITNYTKVNFYKFIQWITPDINHEISESVIDSKIDFEEITIGYIAVEYFGGDKFEMKFAFMTTVIFFIIPYYALNTFGRELQKYFKGVHFGFSFIAVGFLGIVAQNISNYSLFSIISTLVLALYISTGYAI